MDTVYIITGANKGLGEAFVDQVLTDKDTYVVSISRSMSQKQNEYLSNGRFSLIPQDLSHKIDYGGLRKLKKLVNNNMKIIFINNAGTINPLNEISNLYDEEIINAVNINVVGPVLIIKYLLKQFPDKNISFVNITSGAANRSIANWAIYSSSKAFIYRFFEIMKEENKGNENFNFRSIDPGMMDTEMQEKIRGSEFPLRDGFDEAKKNNKLFTPVEVAKRILEEI